MLLRRTNIFYGWFVVIGGALVVFGVAGSQFSFGVFLTPIKIVNGSKEIVLCRRLVNRDRMSNLCTRINIKGRFCGKHSTE